VIDRQKHLSAGASNAASTASDASGSDVNESDVNAHADDAEARVVSFPSTVPRGRDGRISSWLGRWRKPIRNWFSVRASVPSADVDSLAQEVFLRLLRYSDDVAAENPQGYLFRIAANVVSEWRLREPHDRGQLLEELQQDSSDQSDETAAHDRVDQQLQQAVGRLPKRQLEVLRLHVNEGLTYKQIAGRLHVTEGMALRELARAYASLRVQLKAQDL
jgi:RNA polymerase sigma factor (sigma-70 family)